MPGRFASEQTGKHRGPKLLLLSWIPSYGGFSYTKESYGVKTGSLELSVKEKQAVDVPIWAGVGAILVGGALLVFNSKRG